MRYDICSDRETKQTAKTITQALTAAYKLTRENAELILWIFADGERKPLAIVRNVEGRALIDATT